MARSFPMLIAFLLGKDVVTKWVMGLFFKTSESWIGIFSKVQQVQRLSRCWPENALLWSGQAGDQGPWPSQVLGTWGGEQGDVGGVLLCISEARARSSSQCMVHGGCSAVPIEPRVHALLNSSVKDRNVVTNQRDTRLQQRQHASKNEQELDGKFLHFVRFDEFRKLEG